MKIYIALCLLAFAGTTGRICAQTAKSEKDTAALQFNALDYRLQKRYIPQGKTVNNSQPGKNFFVSAFGGFTKTKGTINLPLIYNGGISVGKEVNSFNAYRVSLIGGKNDRYRMGGIEAAHLFNFLDYLRGYRSGCHMGLKTVWGIGAYAAKHDARDTRIAASLHAGLQAVYHVSSHWDWYVEPKLYLLTDDIDGYGSPKGFDAAYGILTGLTYRFTGMPVEGKSKDAGDDLFIEAAIGLQGDFSSDNREHISNPGLLGPTASLSLGKWLMPLGVRATVFGGIHHTADPIKGVKQKEAYAGGRMEAMVNLNTLFKPSVTDPRFEVNVMGGYELGGLAHRGASYQKKIRVFHGPTAAGQLVYFIDGQYGIFAEARYAKSMYTQPMTSGITLDRRMQNFSLMFGVQYRRHKDEFDAKRKGFTPYNFGYASVGANLPVEGGLSKKQIFRNVGEQISVGVGRQFTYLSAVRAGLELGYYKKAELVPVSIKADYLLNVINMIDYANDNRIFDAEVFGGLVYTFAHSEGKVGHFGIEGGIQESFRLGSDSPWSVFLEEEARLFKGRVTPYTRNFFGNKYSVVLNASIGVKYRF